LQKTEPQGAERGLVKSPAANLIRFTQIAAERTPRPKR